MKTGTKEKKMKLKIKNLVNLFVCVSQVERELCVSHSWYCVLLFGVVLGFAGASWHCGRGGAACGVCPVRSMKYTQDLPF